MVGDEADEPLVGVFDIAKVSRPVDRVEADFVEVRGVADVMQPGSADQQFGIVADDLGDVFRGMSDALYMRPPCR